MNRNEIIARVERHLPAALRYAERLLTANTAPTVPEHETLGYLLAGIVLLHGINRPPYNRVKVRAFLYALLDGLATRGAATLKTKQASTEIEDLDAMFNRPAKGEDA